MLHQFRWALMVPVLCTGLAIAQGHEGKESPKGSDKVGEAEVRFADGSSVRVTLLQPAIEVQTRYGKLTVPVQEIRHIEMGVHLSEPVRQRAEIAIRQLGSKVYKEREVAVRDLVALGALAYPMLQSAAQSSDEEVSKRANTALTQIRAKVPAEYLRTKVEDLLETADFPVVGRILSPTIKVRTAYFGDVDLRLPELRQIRFYGSAGETEVAVDSSRYGSAQGQWMDTGLTISERTRLKITATGQVDLWSQTPGQYMATPKGYGGTVRPGTSALPGTLMGRIGENGTVFPIGESYEGTPNEVGKLYLHIVPSPWNNASTGSYQVRIGSSLATAWRR